MDNFFSSPALFRLLVEKQTSPCGTLRVSRMGIPNEIKRAQPEANAPLITAKDGHILYISWYDKRTVNLMITAHSAATFCKRVRTKKNPQCVREVDKPCAIQSYSQHLGGVDCADKAIANYMIWHRTCKWWKKCSFLSFRNLFLQSAHHMESITRRQKNKRRTVQIEGNSWNVDGLQYTAHACSR